MTSVLVTGVAGFVGSHVARVLLARGESVVGIDNFSDYYDPVLKFARVKPLRETAGFTFVEGDISDRGTMLRLAERHGDLDRIVHLAAQPGIRHSKIDPYVYVQTNVMGHLVLLELARRLGPQLGHLVYASSSSVYGGNDKIPFAVGDRVDHPVSLYAATKRSGELMTETYVHQYGLKATGLRYFTVYGPWGRPDMSPYIFAQAIHEGRTIPLYHHGRLKRDFTYIDDIVEAVVRMQDIIPQPNLEWTVETGSPADSSAPYRVYNIGNSSPVELMDYITALEEALGMVAEKNMMPIQPGDVLETSADTKPLYDAVGFRPQTTVRQGVKNFVDWYKAYYKV